MAFLPHDLYRSSSLVRVVNHKVNASYNSRTVWHGWNHHIYWHIHTELLYSHTGYHQLLLVGSCREKKLSKMPPTMASGRISRELFKPGFYTLIANNQSHKPAGYDVSSCFRLAVMWVWKLPKMASSTALDRISVTRRLLGPTNWWASCFTYFNDEFVSGIGILSAKHLWCTLCWESLDL